MNKDKSLNNRDGEEGDVDMVQKMKKKTVYIHMLDFTIMSSMILTTATIKNNV